MDKLPPAQNLPPPRVYSGGEPRVVVQDLPTAGLFEHRAPWEIVPGITRDAGLPNPRPRSLSSGPAFSPGDGTPEL
jgi:hypothetical protein